MLTLTPLPKQLFCILRKVWIPCTPEERVRQSLIHDLIHQLDYPASHLVIEVQLNHLPHLQKIKFLPKRRIDLVVLAPSIHPFYEFFPLLLIECKSVALSSQTMRQVWGYNYFVQAPFIAAVNSTTIRLEWQKSVDQSPCFYPYLISYKQLIKMCS